jgi:hypothetical protein
LIVRALRLDRGALFCLVASPAADRMSQAFAAALAVSSSARSRR